MILINFMARRMGNLMTDEQRRRRFAKPALPHTPGYRQRGSRAKPHDRDAYLLRAYGLTAAEVAAMIERQYGRCPGCSTVYAGSARSRTAPVVDHCHRTGRVRGILCNRCNMTLGLMDDSAVALRALADYLSA